MSDLLVIVLRYHAERKTPTNHLSLITHHLSLNGFIFQPEDVGYSFFTPCGFFSQLETTVFVLLPEASVIT